MSELLQLEEILAQLKSIPLAQEPKTATQIGKPGLIFITANQAGCIKFAEHFIQGALQPLDEFGVAKPLQFSDTKTQYVEGENFYGICFVQHSDEVPISKETIKIRRKKSQKGNPFILLTCGVISFILLMIFGVGIATCIDIFTGAFNIANKK